MLGASRDEQSGVFWDDWCGASETELFGFRARRAARQHAEGALAATSEEAGLSAEPHELYLVDPLTVKTEPGVFTVEIELDE
jgi:hypothetical protein